MSGCGLILAAHGSRYEPAVNAQVRAFASAIAQRGLFDEVAVAFHQGLPTYSEAIDRLWSTDIVVVPVMTSEGYYCDTVLPRELGRNQRYSQVILRQTIPLGLHPRIPELVARRIDTVASRFGLSDETVSIAIVGHGTPKHPQSRSSTQKLAVELAKLKQWPQVFAAFIDEKPFVDAVCELAEQANVVVLPFLIGAGPHAVADVPIRVGLSVDSRVHLPIAGSVHGRTVVCDAPVGSDPGVIELIVDLACSSGSQRGSTQSRRVVA